MAPRSGASALGGTIRSAPAARPAAPIQAQVIRIPNPAPRKKKKKKNDETEPKFEY